MASREELLAKDVQQATVVSSSNSAAVVTISAPQAQTASNYITGVILSASGTITSAVSATLTNVRGAGTLTFNLPATTIAPMVQMFETHPLLVTPGSDAVLTLPALGTGIVGTATVLYITGSGEGTGTVGNLDALLQPFADGDYDGKPMKLYGTSSGYPNTGTDRLIGTWTLATPALDSIVSPTEIALSLVSQTETLTNASESSTEEDKYLVIDPLGTTPIFLSVGASDNDFDARVVVDDMDMFGGDSLTLPTIHILAATTLHHYAVTRSPASGIVSGDAYTATAQAKDAGGADVHVIGRSIVGSYVAVSGAGADGDVDGTPVVSNKYGRFEPIDCTAGTYPKTETTHVADGDGITGDTSNLVVGDAVDGYDVSSSNDTPAAGETVTITAQAKQGGSNASIAGRVVTWGDGGDGSFGASTSTTDSSGIATISFTAGSTLGTVYNVTATDANGETGTSEDITVSWVKGINARGTSGYVTDGPNDTYVLASDTYPVTRNGVTFGWENTGAGLNAADRSASVDARLAGINYVVNAGIPTLGPLPALRITLPATGDYDIRIALGDASFAQGYQYCQILDDTTVLATIDDSGGTAVAHFDDATGTDRTAAAWPGSNASIRLTFTTTTARVVIGTPTAQTAATTLAHVSVRQV